jgi:hypothetical protein
MTSRPWRNPVRSYPFTCPDHQHPSTPRGLLVIFNLAPTAIVAPEHWLKGRYLIIPINLQMAPPSQRQHSLEILEGTDTEITKVVQLSSSTPGPKRGVAGCLPHHRALSEPYDGDRCLPLPASERGGQKN